ncbi:MAG: YdeI/OmpD-associated family protein [Cellulomonas sp.]|uniref:YdeI/OmpD-associated family protein n=1 Tax=Cellulomonas sp. TaxID=40001 RepID=UPI00180A26A3|nr:YdeI/OmpD-associated family protein [Cellulomonas sp.]
MEVDVVRDDEPRAVEVPDDLQAALDDDLAVRAGSASLFRSNQRRHVVPVTTARTVETRERRIGAVLAELASGRRA